MHTGNVGAEDMEMESFDDEGETVAATISVDDVSVYFVNIVYLKPKKKKKSLDGFHENCCCLSGA